jgi:hypothetical protein
MMPWYQSKQFWFNVLAVVVTVATAFGYSDDRIDPRAVVIAQLAVAVINVVLRFAFPGGPPAAARAAGARVHTLGEPVRPDHRRGYGQPVRRANRVAAAAFAASTAGLAVLLLV